MLVLSRKTGERILIGDQIAITIVKVAHGNVRVGVEAPREMAVVREELAQEIRLAEEHFARQADSDNMPTIAPSVTEPFSRRVPPK